MRRILAPGVVVLVLAAAPAAAAPPASQPASQPAASRPFLPAPASSPRARPEGPLWVDWRVDLPVTGVLGVGVVAETLAESKIGPHSCRWCEPNLNAFDAAGRHAKWGSHLSVASGISDVTGFVLTPGLGLGLVTLGAVRQGGWWQAAADDLVILEAAAVEAALVTGLKYAVARKRPYVRDAAAGAPTGGEDNLSFPSGHTSLAFCMATAAGTVATMRGYREAPYVWGFGMGLATLTGYLRMAADKHYASDVIVGAAIGSLVGWAVPYLWHRRWRRR